MATNDRPLEGEWALILGASSGFGEAVALELAAQGMHIAGVHLDRKSTLPNVERIQGAIRALGREARFFNVNAADADKRREVVAALREACRERGGPGTIRVLLHSLAFGTLKRFIPGTLPRAGAAAPADTVSQPQMEMTLDVMANSLVYWVQALLAEGLLGRGGRIFAMTSAGSARVWATYGAVSAAKAALESHVRQLTLELAPAGITANAVMAGITDTPALRKIPGSGDMLAWAGRKNPSGRLTTPKDVAEVIGLLSRPQSHWLTGNVLCVDGGEFIVD